jgi:hypothetical protein
MHDRFTDTSCAQYGGSDCKRVAADVTGIVRRKNEWVCLCGQIAILVVFNDLDVVTMQVWWVWFADYRPPPRRCINRW